jgi:hypothetical protein
MGEVTLADVDPTAAPPAPVRRLPTTSGSWLASAAVSGVLVTLVRRFVSRGRDEYSIWPDEPAQLAIARYVGGGERWYMHNHSIWRPGFGTLLSPVHWFTDDPTTVFHVALALNAVLGGVAAVLLVVLAARLTGLGAWPSAAVAVLVSLSPAVLFTSDFVYSESLLLVLYVAALLLLMRFHAQPAVGVGVGAGVVAGLAFGTHSRMLPLTFVVIGIALLAGWRRRLSWGRCALVVGVAGATAALMSVYTDLLVERLWNEPSTRNSPEGVAGQLDDVPAILVALIGQTWSLLVASVGLVGYGAWALGLRALRRGTPADDQVVRAGDARVVLAASASLVALSVVFMADRWRSDQLVYGRYNAVAVLPVVVVGIGVLLGSPRVRRLAVVVVATAASTTGTAALLWVMRRELLESDNGLEPMILGLQPFITSPTRIDVPLITAISVAVALALGITATLLQGRRHRTLIVVAAVALVVVAGAWRTDERVRSTWNPARSTRAVAALRAEVLTTGVPVDYLLPAGSNSTQPMMLYQFHLPETAFAVVTDPLAGAPNSFVFAPDDDDALRGAGARIVWRDPHRPIALWQRG